MEKIEGLAWGITEMPIDWDKTMPYILAMEIMGYHKCPMWGAWSTKPMTDVNPRNNGTFKFDMDNVYGWNPDHNVDQAMMVATRIADLLPEGSVQTFYMPNEKDIKWEVHLNFYPSGKRRIAHTTHGGGDSFPEAVCDMAMNLLSYYPKNWAKANKTKKKK